MLTEIPLKRFTLRKICQSNDFSNGCNKCMIILKALKAVHNYKNKYFKNFVLEQKYHVVQSLTKTFPF